MRYSILGFNQQKVVEANLDIIDLLLLNYIIIANGTPSLRHIVKDEVSYVWLSHKKIQEDLPITNITEGTLKNRLSALKKNGYIVSEVVSNNKGKGSMVYYSVTDLTVSFQNDLNECSSNSKMTSNNNSNIDYNEEDNILLSNDNNNEKSEYESHLYSEEDFLGSAKKKKKKRGLSLWDKCVNEINDYTDIPELKSVLTDYLKFRIGIKDKPIYNVNQWKSMLRKLDDIVEETKVDYKDIVKNSLNRGWLNFYPINDKSKKDVFSEYNSVNCEKGDEEFVGEF